MIVRRLGIHDHPVLANAFTYVRTLEAPAPPYRERGDVRAELAKAPPDVDRNRPASCRFKIIEWVRPWWLPPDVEVASVNYYPAGGSGLGWHTDSTRPGWRVYVARPLARAGALIVRGEGFADAPGVALAFYVSGKPCDSWHGVYCPDERFSVGLWLPDSGSATARSLGLERKETH